MFNKVKLTLNFCELQDYLDKLYYAEEGIGDLLSEHIYSYGIHEHDIVLKDMEIQKKDNLILFVYTNGVNMTVNNWETKISLKEITTPRSKMLIEYIAKRIFDNFIVLFNKDDIKVNDEN